MSDNIDLPSVPGSGCAAVLQTEGYMRVTGGGWTLSLDSLAATETSLVLTSASGNYGTQTDGLYLLDGESDTIEWSCDFGRLNFGTEEMKRLPAVYIGAASLNKIMLTVGLPDETEWEYEARSFSDTLKIHRFDTGRGLRANWFNLSLPTQIGGATIASLSFADALTNRRI
jgi:hypothetical protein